MAAARATAAPCTPFTAPLPVWPESRLPPWLMFDSLGEVGEDCAVLEAAMMLAGVLVSKMTVSTEEEAWGATE